MLVDEYQDTNRLQASILLALKPDGRGLTVVGDDAQSIYSFRGATVRNILDFPRAVRSARARRSRSSATTARRSRFSTASNAVIELARERYTKNLWTDKASAQRPHLVTVADEADQARYVVEQVLEAREAGMKLKSQAVLFRAAHHSAALEIELTRRNIPFVKFGGLKFLDSVHVKDVLAVLRWAENPRDRVAGFRVAQLLPGIGPATAEGACSNRRARGQRQSGRRCARTCRVRRAGAHAEDWHRVRRADVRACAARETPWPRRVRDGAALVRAASRAQSRRRGDPHRRTCCRWRASRARIRRASAF